MLKDERQEAIVALCNQRNSLTVREAAKALKISDMTARRDFDELAEEGRIIRVYGGARAAKASHSIPSIQPEQTHEDKFAFKSSEKLSIAKTAATLVEENDTIFISSGTTTETFVKTLPEISLNIVTASIAVFGLVVEAAATDLGLYKVFLLGGEYNKDSMTLSGPTTFENIKQYGIDKAFIGTNGIDDKYVYGHNEAGVYALRQIISQANQSYILADASKIGKKDLYAISSLENTDALITDEHIAEDAYINLSQYTKVIRATSR